MPILLHERLYVLLDFEAHVESFRDVVDLHELGFELASRSAAISPRRISLWRSIAWNIAAPIAIDDKYCDDEKCGFVHLSRRYRARSVQKTEFFLFASFRQALRRTSDVRA